MLINKLLLIWFCLRSDHKLSINFSLVLVRNSHRWMTTHTHTPATHWCLDAMHTQSYTVYAYTIYSLKPPSTHKHIHTKT